MYYKNWIRIQCRNCRGKSTLKEMSEKTGISVSYLSDIERGRTVPTLETISKIFKAGGKELTIGFLYTESVMDNCYSEYVFVEEGGE